MDNSPDNSLVVKESLNAVQQLTKELMRSRRNTTIFRLAFFSIGVSFAFAMGSKHLDKLNADSAGATAKVTAGLVEIRGAIMPDGSASASKVNPMLERAFKDESTSSVIIVVNSPGGTPVQSNLIRAKIDELQEKHAKPAIVVAEDMLTSGAYLIAVAGDKILVDPTSVVGSIGVVSRGFGFSGLMEKIGVERRVQTAGEAKNMADPFVAATDADKAAQQEMLNDIHEVFIDTVKTARGDKLKLDTPGLFSGKVWIGQKAIDAGLVDGMGSVRSAMDSLKVTELVHYRSRSPLGILDIAKGLGGISSTLDDLRVSAETASSLPLALPFN